MLAFLHISLTKAKEKKKCLGGHSYFLSVRIIIYLFCFLHSLFIVIVFYRLI